MYAVSFFETFHWIMLKMELKFHIFEKNIFHSAELRSTHRIFKH